MRLVFIRESDDGVSGVSPGSASAQEAAIRDRLNQQQRALFDNGATPSIIVTIHARSPKGNVGVTDVVDAGELSAYSAGVLSGFTAASAASWTLQIGGVSGTQDVAIAKNPGGESELFSGTAGQSIAFVIGGAPGTPGQSRTDALVIYKDPFTTSVVNNGVDVTDYQVVPGTAATTGSQVAPDDVAIRAAIPTGTLKFVAVIGYVTTAYGASGTTTGAEKTTSSKPEPRA